MFSALAVCAAGLMVSSSASAQTASVPASGVKIGVVNFQTAILDTAEIKKASADLQAKFRPRQQALEGAQRELNDIQQQLQTSQGKLSPEGEIDLESRGQRKQREVQRLNEDLQADVNRERTDILQSAGKRMTAVIKKLADEKGLDLVIDTTNAVTFKPSLDITADAVAAYDKAYPVK
ncbi:MAG: OmpH family outer membrane protein [Bryobacteraceae bacterium]